MKNALPPVPSKVTAAFESYPPLVQPRLYEVRSLIYQTSLELDGVGPLTETLKWGQPSYLTETTRSGSTIRLGNWKDQLDRCAIFFNCNTDLVSTFRDRFPNGLEYSGNRAIILSTVGEIDQELLAHCIGMALTYHQNKSR